MKTDILLVYQRGLPLPGKLVEYLAVPFLPPAAVETVFAPLPLLPSNLPLRPRGELLAASSPTLANASTFGLNSGGRT